MKQIYSLGGGCHPYYCMEFIDNLKKYQCKECIYKAMGMASKTYSENFFLPSMIFQDEILNDLWNTEDWDVFFRKPPDNLFLDIVIQNKKYGINCYHVQLWSRVHTMLRKCAYNKYIDTFKNNINNFIYVIDFQRGYYQYYTNKQLLDFENLISNLGLNLDNFIYIDCINTYDREEGHNIYLNHEEDRFKNCKIKHFIMDKNEIHEQDYPITYSFLEKERFYRNSLFFYEKYQKYLIDLCN